MQDADVKFQQNAICPLDFGLFFSALGIAVLHFSPRLLLGDTMCFSRITWLLGGVLAPPMLCQKAEGKHCLSLCLQ